MSVAQSAFHGFANPVDPSPAELRAWAYNPDSVPLQTMPPDWDLLVAGDRLIVTLFELAMDRSCPARRFALHCLYIYAADGIRTQFRAHPKRRLRKLVQQAEEQGDELMTSGHTTAACCWPGRTSSTTTTGARAAWCARAAGSASDRREPGTPRGVPASPGLDDAAVAARVDDRSSDRSGDAAPHDQRGRRATGRHEVSPEVRPPASSSAIRRYAASSASSSSATRSLQLVGQLLQAR